MRRVSGAIARWTFWLALGLSGLARPSVAQETLVPLDPSGRLMAIDAELERTLQAFPEFPDFREARLFQLPDSSYALEITYGTARLQRVRRPLSVPEAEALRQTIWRKLQAVTPRKILDQAGRTKLLVGSTLVSLGFCSWAVPAAVDAENTKTDVALALLSSGGGICLPIFLTKGRAVSDASATLYGYGATRGIGHGMLLLNAVTEDPGRRGLVTAGLFASLAEALGGYALAGELELNPGQAEMIGAGGDFGAGIGGAAAHLSDMAERATCTTLLLGSGSGLVAGRLLGRDGRYTRGDAYLFRACATLGACLPLGLVDLGEPEDDRIYTAFATAGGLAGMAYGHHLAARRQLSGGEGAIVNLGMLGGGLVGLGAAYLVINGPDRSAEYLLGGTAGAAGGFALALHWVGEGSNRGSGNHRASLLLYPGLLPSPRSGFSARSGVAPLPGLLVSARF